MNRTVSTSDLAKACSVTNATVRYWVSKKGCPCDKKRLGISGRYTYKFNLEEVNEWGVNLYGEAFKMIGGEK